MPSTRPRSKTLMAHAAILRTAALIAGTSSIARSSQKATSASMAGRTTRFNHWELAPLLRITSGAPFTVTTGLDNSLTAVNNDRAESDRQHRGLYQQHTDSEERQQQRGLHQCNSLLGQCSGNLWKGRPQHLLRPQALQPRCVTQPNLSRTRPARHDPALRMLQRTQPSKTSRTPPPPPSIHPPLARSQPSPAAPTQGSSRLRPSSPSKQRVSDTNLRNLKAG